MHRAALVILLVLGSTSLPAIAQTRAEFQYEDESRLRFRTSDIVPRDLLAGPNYELDEETELEDGRFVFRINTKWGVLTAHGRPMLAVRLREMEAIERARTMNREPQVVGAFLGTLVDTGKGTKILLTDPIGSLRRAPKAIGRSIKNDVSSVHRRAGGETRRRLAAELGCDPETDNPILDKLLDWIAVRQKVGRIGGRVGLNLITSGLALVPTTAQYKEMLATRSPSEINDHVEGKLVDAGYDAELAERFVRAEGPTTMQRLMMLERLLPLAEATGHDALLERAVAAETMSDGMTILHELLLVERLREDGGVVRIAETGYLLVTQRDGRQVVVCADGYRVLDRPLHVFATKCRAASQQPTVSLYGRVQFSDRAAAALNGWGIQPARRTGIAGPSADAGM